MTRRQYSNVAPAVQTVGSLTAGTTAGVATSLGGYPSTFPYTVALERGTASEELVSITAAVGTSVTMVRGYGGTTAKSHQTGATFEHVVDATDADEANLHVNSSSGVHGVTGSVVGTTDTQTLTAKTLSSSRGLATATDPGLKLQATGSGTADQLQCLDTAGTTTVASISRTGAISAVSSTLTAALSAATASIAGAVSAASAAIVGAVTAASATISGLLTTGTLQSGAATFTGNVTAPNIVTRVGSASDSAVQSTTAGEAKDAGVGDVTFTAVTGRKYRLRYVARAESATGTNSIDFRIRDGGASSPTTSSTLLAGASAGTVPNTGADSIQLIVDELITGLSAGTHTVAAFHSVTTGGGTIRPGQASGQSRQLTVFDEGTV